jgi:hypothetical protein
MLTEREFDDLCRGLYLDLRGGVVDRQSAFDLSADVLAKDRADDAAAKVAALALDDDADDAALAAAVRTLLVYRYEPTFDDEPGWFAALEAALEIVKADLRASGLPEEVRLYTWEGSRNALVDAWAANSTAWGIFPEAGADPVRALIEVADDAQDAVMHSIWGAWPTCPEHRLGVHALAHDGAAVWWCPADGGHIAARIGQLPRGSRA